MERIRELQRRLATELDDHPVKRARILFHAQNLEDMLQRQRFEIETVGCIVVGRDRLGVAVDHDGLIAHAGQ